MMPEVGKPRCACGATSFAVATWRTVHGSMDIWLCRVPSCGRYFVSYHNARAEDKIKVYLDEVSDLHARGYQ